MTFPRADREARQRFGKEETMRLIIALIITLFATLAAHATDGPCLDTNIAVATEIANMQAFIKILGIFSTASSMLSC